MTYTAEQIAEIVGKLAAEHGIAATPDFCRAVAERLLAPPPAEVDFLNSDTRVAMLTKLGRPPR